MAVSNNTRKEFEATDTDKVDVSKLTKKQKGMIPILQKLDKEFVDTLPAIMDKIVQTFFKACVDATINKAQSTNIVKPLTPDKFERMVNKDIMPAAIKCIVMDEPKNVIKVLEKRFFARKISNYKDSNTKLNIKMVPWVVGGLTVLGFDESQQKTIAKWVNDRIVNQFVATSRDDKDKLFDYKLLETYHPNKILRHIKGVNDLDDIMIEDDQDDDIEELGDY